MPREGLTLAQTEDVLFSLITGRSVGVAPADPASFVVETPRASAAERVAVYAFMYRARLVEALASQFPRLAQLLGAEAFAELTHGYMDDHPSTQPSLRFLGANFADWLSHKRPKLAELYIDLTKLEWSRADIFDTRDEPVLDLDAIRSWPQEHFAELPIKLVAAHRLLVLRRGTAAHWQRIGSEAAVEEVMEETAEAAVKAAVKAAVEDASGSTSGSESILVWRQGASVFHRLVDDAEASVLTLAASGTTLGIICESAASQPAIQDPTRQSFAWLWSWSNDHLLSAP